jgi:putative transcriptional regulator
MRERRTSRKPPSYAGQLLLAHPALREATFRRTVILLSVHNPDGAMGVVLNRPLDRQLGELNAEFALGPLAGVPVYCGGPVAPEQLIIVSWQWLKPEQTFELHFGLEPEKAQDLIGAPGVTLRAFLGYAGWSEGPLDNEMKHDTWLTSVVAGGPLEQRDGIPLWRALLGELDPELKLLAEEPEDPTVN